MNILKLFKQNFIKGGTVRVIITSLFATLACTGIIYAATTVGTNISTTGTITGSGVNTLYGATSIGGAITATSTLSVSGIAVFDSNVGIGTSSPYAKLSVVGEIVGSYFTATSTTATSTFPKIAITGGSISGVNLTGQSMAGMTWGAVTGNITGAFNTGATFTVCAADRKAGQWKCDFTGDGINDQVAIQSALSACPTISMAGSIPRCKIQLTEGTFKFGGTVNIDRGNFTLQGAGSEATILVMRGGINADMFKNTRTANTYFVTFRDFSAYGNRPAWYPTSCNLVNGAPQTPFTAKTGSTGTTLIDTSASYNASTVTPVGARVWNVTDNTYTTIQSVNSSTQITLAADIGLTSSKSYCLGEGGALTEGEIVGNTSGKFIDMRGASPVGSFRDFHTNHIFIQQFSDDAFISDTGWGHTYGDGTVVEFNTDYALKYLYDDNPSDNSNTGLKVLGTKLIANDGGSIYLGGMGASQISNSELSGGLSPNAHAVYIGTNAGTNSTGNILNGNVIMSSTGSMANANRPNAIHLGANTTSTNIIGNFIGSAGSPNGVRYGYGLYITDQTVADTNVVGNQWQGSFGTGLSYDTYNQGLTNFTKYFANSGFEVEARDTKSIQCVGSAFAGGDANTTKVTHGLSVTPTWAQAMVRGHQSEGPITVSNIGATTFDIDLATSACIDGQWYTFDWEAMLKL